MSRRNKYPIIHTVHSHIKFTHVKGDKMNVNMTHDTCSTTGKPTRSFATERVSLDSV